MLRTLRPLLIAPIALALWGCTIHYRNKFNEDPKPAPASQKGAPANKAAGSKPSSASGTAGSTQPASTTTTADQAPRITSSMAFGNGTGGAFRGLGYVVPEGTTGLPNLASLVPFATLFTDSFQIKSQEFSGGFPGVLKQEEWFAIRYEGTFMIPKDGSYKLRLVADDGAVLTIDGQPAMATETRAGGEASAQRDFKAGAHQLRLDYYQGKKGTVALMLFLGTGGQEQPLVGKK
jgi:hypothetical protein